ncbi:MAG: hypothetical protein Q9191_006860 [Dirinaria sp. TL-2023a]
MARATVATVISVLSAIGSMTVPTTISDSGIEEEGQRSKVLVLHDEIADDRRGDEPRKRECIGHIVDIFA